MAKINWKEGLSLERDVAEIIQRQEQHGVYFDIGKAHFLISHLEELKEELYKQIRPFLMYDIQNQESKQYPTKEKLEKATEEELILLTNEYSCVRKIKLKNGCYNTSVLNHFNDPIIVAGPFSRIQIEEPSIGKRQLIVKQLLKLGWKPTEFTEKGFPQLTIKGEPVESLLKVGSFGKDLSLWYTYSHRQSQIKGFLPHVRHDGRISAQLDPCATNTFRGAHRVVANIPRPTSVFGKEMRSLFTVPDNKVFVGADVSGLELRMLAHHMKDPEYIKQILEGDIHSYNQEKAGLPTRDDAKTFIYGFLYGAGNEKIGSIVNGTAKAGKRLKDTFFAAIPLLAELINKVKNFAQKYGFVPTIDGRKLYIRSFEGRLSLHTALNALLQGDGSIVTKRAMVICDREIKKRGIDAHQIIFYHDEFAYECSPEDAEEVGEIMVDSMRLAGEYYNLRIPIDGKYAIGRDWGVH